MPHHQQQQHAADLLAATPEEIRKATEPADALADWARGWFTQGPAQSAALPLRLPRWLDPPLRVPQHPAPSPRPATAAALPGKWQVPRRRLRQLASGAAMRMCTSTSPTSSVRRPPPSAPCVYQLYHSFCHQSSEAWPPGYYCMAGYGRVIIMLISFTIAKTSPLTCVGLYFLGCAPLSLCPPSREASILWQAASPATPFFGAHA